MSDDELYQLEQAGFTEEQIDALVAVFAIHGHSHDIRDIIGLEDELDEIEGSEG